MIIYNRAGDFPQFKIKNMTATNLAVYTPQKAIDVRRKMLASPELFKDLSSLEVEVFRASTATTIKDYSRDKMIPELCNELGNLATDVGYTKTDDFGKKCSRIAYGMVDYYPDLTIQEVRLMFGLFPLGRLDKYFPKDNQGNPDNKHYQQFSMSYIAKIIDAYSKFREEVIAKVYEAKAKMKMKIKIKIKPHKRPTDNSERYMRYRGIYLEYKYTGRLKLGLTGGMFLYNWLRAVGLADEVKGTEDDRKTALARYTRRVARGLVNPYEACNVKRQGIAAPELDYTAYEIARDREIKTVFARMIAEERQIDEFFKK